MTNTTEHVKLETIKIIHKIKSSTNLIMPKLVALPFFSLSARRC